MLKMRSVTSFKIFQTIVSSFMMLCTVTYEITICLWTYYNGIFSGVDSGFEVKSPKRCGCFSCSWCSWASPSVSYLELLPTYTCPGFKELVRTKSWEAERVMMFWMTSATWRKLGPLRRTMSGCALGQDLAAQRVIWGPHTSASPGSWFEMQNLRCLPDLLNQTLPFTKIPRWLICTLMFERLCSDEKVFVILEAG